MPAAQANRKRQPTSWILRAPHRPPPRGTLYLRAIPDHAGRPVSARASSQDAISGPPAIASVHNLSSDRGPIEKHGFRYRFVALAKDHKRYRSAATAKAISFCKKKIPVSAAKRTLRQIGCLRFRGLCSGAFDLLDVVVDRVCQRNSSVGLLLEILHRYLCEVERDLIHGQNRASVASARLERRDDKVAVSDL